MKCDFQVGDEVICISNDMPDIPVGKCWVFPEIGTVYHIASMAPVKAWERLLSGWDVAVTVAEISAYCTCMNLPVKHPSTWFRKVEKLQKPDAIEVFRKIVREVEERKSVPEKETVDA